MGQLFQHSLSVVTVANVAGGWLRDAWSIEGGDWQCVGMRAESLVVVEVFAFVGQVHGFDFGSELF